MIRLKNKEQLDLLREGGRRLSRIIHKVAEAVAPGVKTRELDDLAAQLIAAGGDQGAFYNYCPAGSPFSYPAHLCASVNEEIVHGIPGARVLAEGDLVTLDLGLVHQGLITDMAITVPVGKISKEAVKLMQVTKEALRRGIASAQPGGTVGDIGEVIERYVQESGFRVARDLSGHGVGFEVHEDPYVPNFGQAGEGDKLLPGLVIAIEPMVTAGKAGTKLLSDGFTFVTRDSGLSAHFEHTIAITESGPEVLTELR
jgi:methionyl aminopeptidase